MSLPITIISIIIIVIAIVIVNVIISVVIIIIIIVNTPGRPPQVVGLQVDDLRRSHSGPISMASLVVISFVTLPVRHACCLIFVRLLCEWRYRCVMPRCVGV